MIRHHRQPRINLYVPTAAECPVPLEFLDVMRTTHTDLEDRVEARIADIWTQDGERSLSAEWTGKTSFDILRPEPPTGYE